MSSRRKATGADCTNSSPRQDQVETSAPIVGEDPAHIKEQLNLIGRLLELCDYQLHELNCGGFVIMRSAFCQYAPDFRAAERLAERLIKGDA